MEANWRFLFVNFSIIAPLILFGYFQEIVTQSNVLLINEEEEVFGGVHEGPDRIGSVLGGAECILQLQTLAAEYEDAYTGRQAVLSTSWRGRHCVEEGGSEIAYASLQFGLGGVLKVST